MNTTTTTYGRSPMSPKQSELMELTSKEEAKIRALVKKAAS